MLAIAARKLNIPYIASGGMGDGRGLAAAMALGASGINIGTRAMCTVESPIHQNIKEAMVKANERDTILVMRSLKNTSRMFKNSISKAVVEIETKNGKNTKFEDIRELVAGARVRMRIIYILFRN